MLIIGESLNATISKVGEAIIARDEAWIRSLALRQVDCGAQALDLNASCLAGGDEASDLEWMISIVQECTSVPLVLDSANPGVLRAALRIHRGASPILSSTTGESQRLHSILSLADENGCPVVALCLDERGIPESAEGRLAIAARVLDEATARGLRPEDIYIDPLVMPVGANSQAAEITLATLISIRNRFPMVRTLCGVSNISFAMPRRSLLNRVFAVMLVAAGLDAFMVDVRDREIMKSIIAAMTMAGRDDNCREYIKAFRSGLLDRLTR